ncbi:PH domain-containing protein [Mycena chlorophos]|uniref:PH domain-containing protein n=1 Tax=Mycena chlorophos TaxID=658473 RepID=A0A8H6W4E1_MYCCL|nr:PH domain-containing protein [Mycena chlorophos]
MSDQFYGRRSGERERFYGNDQSEWYYGNGESISSGPKKGGAAVVGRQSAFSTPSSSSGSESEDDYGEADPIGPASSSRRPSNVGQHSISSPPISTPVARDTDSDEDDVPLAQQIPSALKAQRTIRRQVREERDQRRREKAERGTSRRPSGAADSISADVASSSREAARMADDSRRRSASRPRQRTQTLPGGGIASPGVDDLTKKLQNLQQSPRPAPIHTSPVPDSKRDRILSPNPATPSSPPTRTQALPEARGLRPMRSFHRPKTAEPLSNHTEVPLPAEAEVRVRRSNTTKRPEPPASPAVAAPSKLTKAPPPTEMRAARPSADAQLKPPVLDSAPPQSHRHVASKSQSALTRVFIGDMQRFNMVDIGPTTNAKEVLTMVEEQGSLKGWVGVGGWMVWEVAQDFGMERPIRSFELLADVQASWNKDKMVNMFLLRLTTLAPILSRSNIPSSSPLFSGYIDWEYKRGKWTKRYMRLKEHSLWLSKRDNGKDEICLCSLSNFDAYHVTRLHKAPKPFVFAVKSTDNLSFFENTADYLHIFSCNQKDGEKWMEKILLARSYVLYQERNVLFNPKAPSGNAAGPVSGGGGGGGGGATGLARAATRKGPPPAAPLLVAPDRNDVFAPGSLLRG